RILLEVENLEIGNGCVASVDLMALGDKRLRKVVRPTGLSGLDLDEGGAHGVVSGLGFAALDEIGHVDEAFVDLLLIARIAAEQKVVQVETIQHDLIAHGLDNTDAIEGVACVGARRLFQITGDEIHQEQESKKSENQSEPGVKFFANGH